MSTPDRRTFLKTSTGAAAAVALTGLPSYAQSSDKLNIAVIGCGGRGGSNLRGVASENIVALCDVDGNNLDKAAAQFPKARKERDFRRLFDHASEFDAVVVSTAEHTHAFATLPALQLGKHVYCEKPLDAQRLGGPRHPRGRREGQASPRRWARRSTPATTTAASSS